MEGSGPVRPSEIIAGASGVQYSYGENTAETDAGGGDFADGSRRNAEANQHANAYTGYKDGSNPMTSPDLGCKGEFSQRYGIGFLCDTYPAGWGNLADIADYSKPNSAFLRAFAGMSQTQQYRNPTRATVLATIAQWVGKLKAALQPGQQGQLVLTFQGHGAHGSFYASDGGEITSADLMALTRQAEQSRVSLTIVMDACFSGGAVPAFQDHAADYEDEEVTANVEGAGQVCSPDNDARAGQLRDQMAHARELIEFSREVARHGDTLNTLVQNLKADDSKDAPWAAAMKENAALLTLIGDMEARFRTNMSFGYDPALKLEEVQADFDAVLSYLNSIQPRTSFNYDDWTGAVGKFQDQIGDGANRILGIIQQAAKKQPAAAAH